VIAIWTTCAPKKALFNLSPVLRSVPDLPIAVVNDYSVPEGTTTILALGAHALRRLQDEKLIAKNRTTTSYRTLPLNRAGVPVLVSYSPEIGEIDHSYYVDLLTDVSLAVRHALTGKWVPKYGTYHYRPHFAGLIASIKAQHAETGQPVDVSADTETLGLDPYAQPMHFPPFPGAYLVTIQATHLNGTADVVRFHDRMHEQQWLSDPEYRAQLEFLLTCPYIKLRGADFKYDQHWLWVRAKLRCTNFALDTTIVGSLLDENRSNSMDVHTKIYVPGMAGYSDRFDAEVNKSRMDQVPPEQLLPYAGGDVDANLQVAAVMKKELVADSRLAGLYVHILRPASQAFAELEQGGMVVDKGAYEELKADLMTEHVRLVKDACKIMGGRIVAKHGNLQRPGGMNLTKASMLCDFMFSPMGLNLKPKMFTEKPDKDGIKRPSTAQEHLEMFSDVPEAKAFIAIIKEDGSVMKTYNTYVVGFLEHLRSDGRFHPTYFLFVGNQAHGDGGARTGRLSCKAPAFQTIPKHTKWAKRIRRCFPAPPGYVLVERDYSQGELRVIACIANETNMIAAYKAGLDLHIKTAARFSGHTYESLKALELTDEYTFSETRQLGKAGNFGLVFGMMEDGFIVYAKQNYGVDLTWDEAHTFREGYFQDYPMLPVYHVQYKQFAREHGHVRTPLGRIRHLPLIRSPNKAFVSQAERQAINSPVQGTLTDLTLWTIALEHQAGLHSIAPCFGACHDSAYNYCPEDKVDVLVPQMLDIMQNLPFEKVNWQPQLQFVADAKVGPNMADLKAFK